MRPAQRRARPPARPDRWPWPWAATGSGPPAPGARRATRSRTTVRDNRQAVERIGIGVIVFIVAWIALGIEVALVGAALVVGFELILRAVSSDEV